MSSGQHEVLTDGSAAADAPVIRVERDDELARMRWRCPNNHTRWVPTNSHVYCHSCSELADAGDGPEWFELLDAKTEETVAFARIELV